MIATIALILGCCTAMFVVWCLAYGQGHRDGFRYAEHVRCINEMIDRIHEWSKTLAELKTNAHEGQARSVGAASAATNPNLVPQPPGGHNG